MEREMVGRKKLGVSVLAFLLGIAASGFGAAVAKVYFLHSYDPKFRDDAAGAFQLELIEVAVLLAVGGVLFITTRWLVGLHRYPRVIGHSVAVAVVAGALYPWGLHLLAALVQNNLDPESPLSHILTWSYLVGYPFTAAILIRTRRTPTSGGRFTAS